MKTFGGRPLGDLRSTVGDGEQHRDVIYQETAPGKWRIDPPHLTARIHLTYILVLFPFPLLLLPFSATRDQQPKPLQQYSRQRDK